MEGSAVGKYVIFGKCRDLHIMRISVLALLVRSYHRLGQSKRGWCVVLYIASLLDSLGCQTVTLRTRRIVLASPNVVAASSCGLYPCPIRLGVRL